METFYSREELAERVKELLLDGDSETEKFTRVTADLIATKASYDLSEGSGVGSADGFELKMGRWVLRDEDVKFFSIIKDGVMASVAIAAHTVWLLPLSGWALPRPNYYGRRTAKAQSLRLRKRQS